ncbi:MAG: hypothetical protein WEA09_11740 [Gemmatimonadota bacterium]
MRRGARVVLVLLALGVWGCQEEGTREPGQPGAGLEAPELLSWGEQVEVREGWLSIRHEMLLDMMRLHDI